jgi:hypothetical protein
LPAALPLLQIPRCCRDFRLYPQNPTLKTINFRILLTSAACLAEVLTKAEVPEGRKRADKIAIFI